MSDHSPNQSPLDEFCLANGMRVEFYDQTNRYYGDYHRVVIEVVYRVPLNSEVCASEDDPQAFLQRARRLFGDELIVRQNLVRMGVPETALEAVKQSLLQSFLSSNRDYLKQPEFPARLLARELARRSKRSHLRPIPK